MNYSQPYDFCIPTDELDGPEIFESEIAACVDSGEYGDKPDMGMQSDGWVSSGHDVFFGSLSFEADQVPGAAHALIRALQGLDPHPNDLEAMRKLYALIRPTLMTECGKTLYAEATQNHYED